MCVCKQSNHINFLLLLLLFLLHFTFIICHSHLPYSLFAIFWYWKCSIALRSFSRMPSNQNVFLVWEENDFIFFFFFLFISLVEALKPMSCVLTLWQMFSLDRGDKLFYCSFIYTHTHTYKHILILKKVKWFRLWWCKWWNERQFNGICKMLNCNLNHWENIEIF